MTINSFQGEHEFLSNEYPCRIYMGGYTFGSVEHALHASKTLSVDERMEVRGCTSIEEVRKLSEKLTLRHDWDQVRNESLRRFLSQKFFGNEDLKKKLLATGEVPITGETENEQLLGSMLMEIRNNLRKNN